MGVSVPKSHDERIAEALRMLEVPQDFRITEQFVSEVLGLIADEPDMLDLKIASAAVTEMRDAFAVFKPYRDVRKVTIFGSARTTRDDPLYEQTRQVAERLAAAGWMVVTGAGPGIMQAGMEGAGRSQSIGVSIRLPFETSANSVIDGDDKHVMMKYFFTRKLMLVKESSAFVCMPGGFGTLDETFELLTLTQTGKGVPVPIVWVDLPGDPYWEQVHRFITDQLVPRGLVAPTDTSLYRITGSCDEAVDEIERFYANYHSIRHVGDELVIRLLHQPTPEQVSELDAEFHHLVSSGSIRQVEPFEVERRQHDVAHLPRLAMRFKQHGYSELRALIDRVNSWV